MVNEGKGATEGRDVPSVDTPKEINPPHGGLHSIKMLTLSVFMKTSVHSILNRDYHKLLTPNSFCPF